VQSAWDGGFADVDGSGSATPSWVPWQEAVAGADRPAVDGELLAAGPCRSGPGGRTSSCCPDRTVRSVGRLVRTRRPLAAELTRPTSSVARACG
jgi:hypothetical protein